jgi:hypothetical protein
MPRPRFTSGKGPGYPLGRGSDGLRAGLDIEPGGKIIFLCRGSNRITVTVDMLAPNLGLN